MNDWLRWAEVEVEKLERACELAGNSRALSEAFVNLTALREAISYTKENYKEPK